MIQVENLSYSYSGSKEPAVKGLDFEIRKGEIFGFLGPSGAGKTTTQKILFKVLHGFDGDITVKGKPLDRWGKEYFEEIGVGFELPNHYLKLTAKENLDLFAAFYDQDRLLDQKTLFESVGLEDSCHKKVEEYSKGMKIRLNFIRALMHDPDIFFFDEPTTGLDPINAHKIKQHLKELQNRGKTIFISTHDMATADDICDRISLIVDGQIVITDVPSVLKRKHGEQKVRVELQNGQTSEFPLEDLGNNREFSEFITQDEILRIHTMEATLEEVFIEVTGREL